MQLWLFALSSKYTVPGVGATVARQVLEAWHTVDHRQEPLRHAVATVAVCTRLQVVQRSVQRGWPILPSLM